MSYITLLWQICNKFEFLLSTELHQLLQSKSYCLVQRIHGSPLHPLGDGGLGMFEAQSLQQPANVGVELSTDR